MLMLFFVVFLVLLPPVIGGPPPNNPAGCGKISPALIDKANNEAKKGRSKRNYIVGGVPTEKKEMPEWLIRIDADGKSICTASLIGKNLAVTAAHCFIWRNEEKDKCWRDTRKMTACLSMANNYEPCPDPIKIKGFRHLTKYIQNNCTIFYDYTVIELSRDVDEKPVCLPTDNNGISQKYDYTSKDAYLLGYSDNNDIDHNKPMNSDLRMVKIGQPTDAGDRNSFIIMKTVPKNNKGNLCGGDSGGPMIQIHAGHAVLIAVNWNCEGNVIHPEAGKPQYNYHVVIRPRFNDEYLDEVSGKSKKVFGGI